MFCLIHAVAHTSLAISVHLFSLLKEDKLWKPLWLLLNSICCFLLFWKKKYSYATSKAELSLVKTNRHSSSNEFYQISAVKSKEYNKHKDFIEKWTDDSSSRDIWQSRIHNLFSEFAMLLLVLRLLLFFILIFLVHFFLLWVLFVAGRQWAIIWFEVNEHAKIKA